MKIFDLLFGLDILYNQKKEDFIKYVRSEIQEIIRRAEDFEETSVNWVPENVFRYKLGNILVIGLERGRVSLYVDDKWVSLHPIESSLLFTKFFDILWKTFKTEASGEGKIPPLKM